MKAISSLGNRTKATWFFTSLNYISLQTINSPSAGCSGLYRGALYHRRASFQKYERELWKNPILMGNPHGNKEPK